MMLGFLAGLVIGAVLLALALAFFSGADEVPTVKRCDCPQCKPEKFSILIRGARRKP